MIEWDDTRLKKNGNRVHVDTKEPVSGEVYKKGLSNIEDELYLKYDSGIKSGEFKIIHHDSYNRFDTTKGVFENDKIKGVVKRFYSDGNTFSEGGMICYEFGDYESGGVIEFSDAGKVTYYRPNGKIDYKRQYSVDNKNNFVEEEYYESGHIKCKATYADYKIDGEYVEYYESGSIRLKKEYKNERFHGLYREYYPSGQIKKEGLYRDGYLDGRWVSYHENGQIMINGNYISLRDPEYKLREFEGIPDFNTEDGRKHGKWVHYDVGGNLIKEEMYKQGKKHGITTIYNRDGTKTEYLYVNGNRSADVSKAKKIWNIFTGKG